MTPAIHRRETTLHLDAEYYDQRGRGYRHTVPVTAAGQQGNFSALRVDLTASTEIAGPRAGSR